MQEVDKGLNLHCHQITELQATSSLILRNFHFYELAQYAHTYFGLRRQRSLWGG